MFSPVNPWDSYKKEDMPTIDYGSISDKECLKYMTIVLSIDSLIIIGVSVLAIVNDLFKFCWYALAMCTILTLVMWTVLIKDYVKHKR